MNPFSWRSKSEQTTPASGLVAKDRMQLIMQSDRGEVTTEAPSTQQWAEQVHDVNVDLPENVRNKVTAALRDESALQMIQGVGRELTNRYGIVSEIAIQSDRTRLALHGKPKKWYTPEKFYIEILKSMLGASLNTEFFGWIRLGQFDFTISAATYDNTIDITILPKEKCNEKDLVAFRELLERFIFPNCDFNAKQRVDEDFIADKIGLGAQDIITMDEAKAEFKLFAPVSQGITGLQIMEIANKLSATGNYKDAYYTRIEAAPAYLRDTFVTRNTIEVYGLHIHDPLKIVIQVTSSGIECTVNLPNPAFTTGFITKFLSPLIKEIYNHITQEDKVNLTDELKNMGVHVQENLEKNPLTLDELYAKEGFVWYADIKQDIEDGIINAWKNKAQFEAISQAEFANIKDIIPNAVLFEGPAGTGKTTISRIIGAHLDYPFFYIPLQSFLSHYYSDSENTLARIFEYIGAIAESRWGAVIMIDEIDEIGGDKTKSHEATKKITGVLLKKLEGMESIQNILLIGATNHKSSLEPALLSRFKYSHNFRLPNESEILLIAQYYLPQLKVLDPSDIKEITGHASGRTIKNICEDIARIAIKNKIDGVETDIPALFKKKLQSSK